MADLERGARISELREQRHFTQSVVADRVGVTLRAYQGWEAGGGILWENAKRLAKVLGSTPDILMSGPPPASPDLSETQLDRMEARLEQIYALLSGEAEGALSEEDEAGAAAGLLATVESPAPPARARPRRTAGG